MNLITNWLNFFISCIADVIDFLGDWTVITGISVLSIIIVVFVAGIITNVFLSRGKA